MRDKLNVQYRDLLNQLSYCTDGVVSRRNARTDSVVHRFVDPQIITWDGPTPCPRWRRLSPHIPLADTIWQMMHTYDTTWLNKHAPMIWKDYATSSGYLSVAYGPRWRSPLTDALVQLQDDPSSRQAYVPTWTKTDTESASRTPMPPCILGLHLLRQRDGLLDMTVMSRSCDVMLGLPHDLMNMAFLQQLFAHELGVEPGRGALMMSDLHLYEQHFEVAERMLKVGWPAPSPVALRPGETRYTIIDEGKDTLVTTMKQAFRPHIETVPYYDLPVPM